MRLVNVIKPTHICNLACTYCYNDDVRRPIMDTETLFITIRETLALARHQKIVDEVDFIWHGGEPLVAGRDFFRKIIEFQSELADGIRFTNSVQTNGTLLDSTWAKQFADDGFDVSLSLDGPAEINDRFRTYRSGAGSFENTWKAIEALRAVGLNPGVCVVLTQATMNRTMEIIDFLFKHQLGFNVIPLTLSGSARDHYDQLAISPSEYAAAWKSMYDRWLNAGDERYVYGHDFVVKTRAILYGKPADCIGMSNCADFNLSVDPLGDVYPVRKSCRQAGQSERCDAGRYRQRPAIHGISDTKSRSAMRDVPMATRLPWRVHVESVQVPRRHWDARLLLPRIIRNL